MYILDLCFSQPLVIVFLLTDLISLFFSQITQISCSTMSVLSHLPSKTFKHFFVVSTAISSFLFILVGHVLTRSTIKYYTYPLNRLLSGRWGRCVSLLPLTKYSKTPEGYIGRSHTRWWRAQRERHSSHRGVGGKDRPMDGVLLSPEVCDPQMTWRAAKPSRFPTRNMTCQGFLCAISSTELNLKESETLKGQWASTKKAQRKPAIFSIIVERGG